MIWDGEIENNAHANYGFRQMSMWRKNHLFERLDVQEDGMIHGSKII